METIFCIVGLSEPAAWEALLQQALNYTLQMIERYMNRQFFAGVGSLCDHMLDVPRAFCISRSVCRTATSAAPLCFARGLCTEYLQDTSDAFHMCEFCDKLIIAFDTFDVQQVKKIFQNIISQYILPATQIKDVLAVCFSIPHFVSAAFRYSDTLEKELFGNKVDPVETLREIKKKEQAHAWLVHVQENICRKLENEFARNQNWLVPSIQKYIEGHPDESLSLNEVASIFDMSPSYISTLFKKHGEHSFSEYVRLVKLNRAKELLSQQIKIIDVSESLGYSDPYYFSRVFKKYEGISPRKYALKYKKNMLEGATYLQ